MKTAILSSTRKVRIGLEHARSPIHWELSLYYLTNKLCGKALFMQIIIWHNWAFTQWDNSYPWELLFKILNNSWLIWQLTKLRRSIVNSLRHEMYFRPTQHNEKKTWWNTFCGLHHIHTEHMLKFQHPVPRTLHLFGIKIFAEAMKMKWVHTRLGRTLNSLISVFMRRLNDNRSGDWKSCSSRNSSDYHGC